MMISTVMKMFSQKAGEPQMQKSMNIPKSDNVRDVFQTDLRTFNAPTVSFLLLTVLQQNSADYIFLFYIFQRK